MKRVLLSADYPNLSGLGIYNIEPQAALNLLIGKIFLFKILHLVIFTVK